MEEGTVLLFSGIYREEGQDIVHFLAIPSGPGSIIDEVELTIKELGSLTESSMLTFTNIKYVQEISITSSGTLIKDPETWTFNHPLYLPNEIYIVMEIPLFKIGLAENLSKGFGWLIDEIILSYARFDTDVKDGERAIRQLFPSEKSYQFSDDAREFSNFMRTEREDYKIFAIEFIKKLCGK